MTLPPLPAIMYFLLASGSSRQPHEAGSSTSSPPSESRWRHRTAKRRERTEQLLNRIESANSKGKVIPSDHGLLSDEISTLANPPIDWDRSDHHELDPIRGGKIRPDTARGARKRAQVEAFVHVVSELLRGENQHDDNQAVRTTIIDAGCGAGNLAIPLAGLLSMEQGFAKNQDGEQRLEVLAVDTNEFALRRLNERAEKIAAIADGTIRTLCADLADGDAVLESIPANHNVIIVSLHACGAASDYAMNLAYKRDAPYAICPCCTAKSLTKRGDVVAEGGGDATNANISHQRSGATRDITYPRSRWLSDVMQALDTTTTKNNSEAQAETTEYSILAKVADVGLGPQTPAQQREHQRRAKKIIELDRLASSSENYEYETKLLRIRHHDPMLYGKGELLLGAKRGGLAANVFGTLLAHV